jgi:dTDP-4-dehydrorhamnose reductase
MVNWVAFNDVDGAEDRPEQAFALNAEFPGRLARAKGVPLVHYSTNYVLDGSREEYRESDAPAPLSVYGCSKWRGEQLVAENGGRWYVLRTAVIFGPNGESELSKEELRRDYGGPGVEAGYGRGGCRRGEQRDVCRGLGGGQARPA